jgi:hypothetical protein
LAPGREGAFLSGEADHFLHVLGGFLHRDGQDVVAFNDSHQRAVFVEHWQAEVVVMFKPTHDLFLVVFHAHEFHLVVHHVLHLGAWRRKHQVAQRDDAHQFLLGVGDVQVVDVRGLRIFQLAQFLLGDGDGLACAKGEEPVVHYAARAVLRVAQQFLGGFGLLGLHFAQQPVLVGRGQLAEQVGCLVGVQLVKEWD